MRKRRYEISERHLMQVRNMTQLEQQLYDDLIWAGSAPDVQQNPDHYGKFVVVHKKCVLGFGSDRQALVQELAERQQLPWQELVVVVVARPDV
jgi:hypothetical protein